MKRTAQKAAETRRDLVLAAKRLVAERGIDGVSLIDIAQAAGYSRGAVHHHFDDKMEIIAEVIEEVGQPLKLLVEWLEQTADAHALPALADATAKMFAEYQSDTSWQVLARATLPVMTKLAADGFFVPVPMQLRLTLEHVFECAAERGELLPPWSPKSASLLYVSALCGLIEQWLSAPGDFRLFPDAERAIRALLASMTRT